MSKKPDTELQVHQKGLLLNFNNFYSLFTESLRKTLETNNVQLLKCDYETCKTKLDSEKKNESEKKNDSEKKSALDQAFRILLLEFINDTKKIGQLISLSIEAVREDIISVTVPVVLLADAFDTLTLDKCEEIFVFVESKVSVWKEELFFATCKNNLLRMCNDLLKRLSRSQNTVFCGRILLFLAKFFPFSERSGLNVISEFNLDNITEYNIEDDHTNEILLNDSTGDSQLKIDHNLYCQFWALQDYFRNPNQCYDKNQWKLFLNHTSSVLTAFDSFKLEDQYSTILSNKKPVKTEDEEKPKTDEYFFAKFLTNPKLLALQLSDPDFRRSVLVQFLILFQYLLSTVKFKGESNNLTASQVEFIKVTEEKIYKLIAETPSQGKRFAQACKHMLSREELWNNWKNEGCKEFKKPECSNETGKPPPTKRSRKALGDLVRDNYRQKKIYFGNDEMTRLWNLCPDNLQACKGEDRNFLPPLETYLESPREKNDPSFEWRALRLIARQSPHFFMSSTGNTSCKINDYLDSMRKKLQKDKLEVKSGLQEPTISVISNEQENVTLDENEDPELLKSSQLTLDDKNVHKISPVTNKIIEDISEKVGSDWKKLAKKLGYSSDEILYYESENATPTFQCKAMLSIWFDDDDDATLENLAYILEGLEINAAADVVKSIIESQSKIEEISD